MRLSGLAGAYAEPNLRATQIELFDALCRKPEFDAIAKIRYWRGELFALPLFSSRILLQDLYVAGILVDDL